MSAPVRARALPCNGGAFRAARTVDPDPALLPRWERAFWRDLLGLDGGDLAATAGVERAGGAQAGRPVRRAVIRRAATR